MSKHKDKTISRRGFLGLLGGTGAAALGLLGGCRGKGGAPGPAKLAPAEFDPMSRYPYRRWEDLYRGQFAWDSVTRSTHSANCTGSCSWMVYVKDGVMLREEQAADYPRINSDLPDYNPRGCNKGACFVEYVYGAQRVKYPLMRKGLRSGNPVDRGTGLWEKVTWDEALEYVADKLLDNIYNFGPDTNNFFSVIPAMSPISFAAGARLCHFVGGVFLSFYDWYCDLPPGEPITWGVQTEACECADWFNAKYIICWGSNISATRIPDAHFAYEARYNGAKICIISPDYNASSIHADQYLPIAPGTDAMLAMGVARQLLEHNWIDRPYVTEQTDMPLLVRADNGKLLRASDLAADGDGEVFYLWDRRTARAVPAPGCMGLSKSNGRAVAPPAGVFPAPADEPGGAARPVRAEGGNIRLDGLDVALEGRWPIRLKDGLRVEVTTVFELLKKELADYPLDRVADVTGLGATEIEAMARDLGTRKPAMIIHGAGTNHWFHNDAINRAMILLAALTGNVGVNGGGFNHYVGQERIWPEAGFKKLSFPRGGAKQRWQNTTLWTYIHSANRDPHPYGGKPIEQWIRESVGAGWMPLWPKNDWSDPAKVPDLKDPPRKPRAMIIWRANYLNQAKGNEMIFDTLFKQLDLIVDINYRMDTTALFSDVVLPAASYYEKADLNSTDCHSYMHPFGAALPPQFDSRSDWQIFAALAKKMAELAAKRGLTPFKDEGKSIGGLGWTRDFTRLYDDWSDNGQLADDVAACNALMADSPETEGMTYDLIRQRPQRFKKTDPHAWTSDIEPGVAYTPYKHHVVDKKPWRTLVGRQQFYVDHDWFLALAEALPGHRDPVPEDDARYPLYWNTPHGRWSIHSTWRDNRYLLRLQRGVPVVYISPDDARARSIADGDWVRIFNQIGATVCICKVLPGERPGRITMYHGWEKYLGFGEGGWQSLTYIKIKPTQLVGGYGHVNFRLNYWGPTGNNRDIRVQIEKFKGEPPNRPA
ncbi:MAG: Perchlorate reductase subunit alpha [Phycisphaerae bacterium]|nr:Perchlorate reductase subunit alpha [Phycisphaerae bacterium]